MSYSVLGTLLAKPTDGQPNSGRSMVGCHGFLPLRQKGGSIHWRRKQFFSWVQGMHLRNIGNQVGVCSYAASIAMTTLPSGAYGWTMGSSQLRTATASARDRGFVRLLQSTESPSSQRAAIELSGLPGYRVSPTGVFIIHRSRRYASRVGTLPRLSNSRDWRSTRRPRAPSPSQ